MTVVVGSQDFTTNGTFTLTNGASAGRCVVLVASQYANPAELGSATFDSVSSSNNSPTISGNGRAAIFYWPDSDLPETAGTYSVALNQDVDTIFTVFELSGWNGLAPEVIEDTVSSGSWSNPVEVVFSTGVENSFYALAVNNVLGAAYDVVAGQTIEQTASRRALISKIDTSTDGFITISTQESDDLNYQAAAFNSASAPSGPSLDTVPSTAYPGQSRTVSGSGFGATRGTGGLTIGGVSQTITSWSDTSITFTTVLGTNSYVTGKTIEVTTDDAGTDSGTIELVADTAGGFGVVTMSNPNTTDESSVAFGATPTVVTGDQFEWEDFNTLGNLAIDAEGFVSSVDTEGTFRGRFWDATDSTWGSAETFTAEGGGDEPGPPTNPPWPFGKGIRPKAAVNWTRGGRHPLTGMRVRIYK